MPLRRRHDREPPPEQRRTALDPAWGIAPTFDAAEDVVDAASSSVRRNAVALVHVGADGTIDRCTYADLGRLAARWARFVGARTRPRDRVLVAVHPGTTWASAILGCVKAGAIVAPVDPEISPHGLIDRVHQVQPTLVLHDGRLADVVAAARPHLAEETAVLDVDELQAVLSSPSGAPAPHAHTALDPAVLVFTRGRSTGRPRPVVHPHAAAHGAGTALGEWLDLRSSDLVWCDAPAGSPTAVVLGLFGTWRHGASVLWIDREVQGRDLVAVLHRVDPSVALLATERLARIAGLHESYGVALPRLRCLGTTGSPLDRALAERVEALTGVPVLDGYSTAEMGLVACARRNDPRRSTAVGTPVGGVVLVPVDESGHVTSVGVVGELAVYGRIPSLCLGYWDGGLPPLESDPHWWTLTGDRGSVDQDGRIHLDAPPPAATTPAEPAATIGAPAPAR